MINGRANRAALRGNEASWLTAFKVLLRADIAVQLRNTRSLYLTFALPIIWVIVFGCGAQRANALGDASFRVGLALTLGMMSVGVMAYSTAVARDRDQGVFQRLRVTPAPTWTIMASSLLLDPSASLEIPSISAETCSSSLAHAWYWARPWGVVLTLLHLPLVNQMVRREEQQLQERFGAEWLAYKNRVRRWL